MARCTHPNVQVGYRLDQCVVVQFRAGEWHDTGRTGLDWLDQVVEVNCPDCGLQRDYRPGTRLPQWLARLWAEIQARDPALHVPAETRPATPA